MAVGVHQYVRCLPRDDAEAGHPELGARQQTLAARGQRHQIRGLGGPLQFDQGGVIPETRVELVRVIARVQDHALHHHLVTGADGWSEASHADIGAKRADVRYAPETMGCSQYPAVRNQGAAAQVGDARARMQ
ncbi:hypothetical protein D3C71_1400570 [compost metagenome]